MPFDARQNARYLVADLLGLGLEFVPVDLVEIAVLDDLVGGFLRDQCIRVIEGPS